MELPSEWKDPPKTFRPLVRWWWPGMDVEPQELHRELEELDQGYFGGVEIQPFQFGVPGYIKQKTTQFHRYAPHPFFYAMLIEVLQDAQQRNFIVDLTLGSAWPPGLTTVTDKDSLRTYMMGTVIIKGPQNFEGPIPKIQLPPFYSKERLIRGIVGPIYSPLHIDAFKPILTVAIRPIKRSVKIHYIFPHATPLNLDDSIDLTDKVDAHGQLHWDVPNGTWQIFTIYLGPSAITPMNEVRDDPNKVALVVDILNRERIKDLLNHFLGHQIERLRPFLGNTLRALFTDSEEIPCEWHGTEHFFTEFQRRRGYDIRPFVPVCLVPNRDNYQISNFFEGNTPCYDFPKGIGDRIRYDWLRTLSDLYSEEYCGAVSEWGKPYHILHRIQNYGIHVDLLQAYAAADIPETEHLFATGVMDFLKFAASAGILFQKPVVSCESMVMKGQEHAITPLKIKVAADKMWIAGVNQFIYHGAPYVHPEISYPSYDPWSWVGMNVNRYNSFWSLFPLINAYIARGQYLLCQGTPNIQIGLFYPFFNYNFKYLNKEDLIDGHLDGIDEPPSPGIIGWFLRRAWKSIDKETRAFQRCANQLMQAGLIYVHFNELALLNGRLQPSERLHRKVFTMGSAQLQALIFPSSTKLSRQAVDKLGELLDAGIEIFFVDKFPTQQPGYLNYQENDRYIQESFQRMQQRGLRILSSRGHLGHIIRSQSKITLPIRFPEDQRHLQYYHRITPFGELFFIRNSTHYHLTVNIHFPMQKQAPIQLELWQGQLLCVRTVQIDPDGVQIRYEFNAYESFMLLFPSAAANYEGLPYSQQKSWEVSPLLATEITDWQLTVHDRKPSGDQLIITRAHFTLMDWRKDHELRYCCGPAIYSTKIEINTEILSKSKVVKLKFTHIYDVAKVFINGTATFPLIAPPYELDITPLVHCGSNEIKVELIGSLRNRLVGYGHEDSRWRGHRKKPLKPCGLVGPIHLIYYTSI